MKMRLIRGQPLTAMPGHRRIHTLSAEGASELELDGDAWRPLYVQDAWQVQARAMLHGCGPWQHAPHHGVKTNH